VLLVRHGVPLDVASGDEPNERVVDGVLANQLRAVLGRADAAFLETLPDLDEDDVVEGVD
jgi:hypothetical protein